MSFLWGTEPLSLQTISSKYALPIAIRPAPGFYGSRKPVILHSIKNVRYAFGRDLTTNQTTKNETDKLINSDFVVVPLYYPAYFQCMTNSQEQPNDIDAEKYVGSIVQRLQIEHRPQIFYILEPMRVFTIESNDKGATPRLWHTIDAHQLITFEQVVPVKYTPTSDDNLSNDDYTTSWCFCFGKQILPRIEFVVKCFLKNYATCYIPCSLTDKLNLLRVGQAGSNNRNELQTIENLLQQFQIPINIKQAKMLGSNSFSDFGGRLRVLGSRNDDFAVCASLSTENVVLIPKDVSIKFLAAPLPIDSPEILQTLARCDMFIQSFNLEIRRILISLKDTASNNLMTIDEQFRDLRQAHSVDAQTNKPDESAIDEDDQSELIATERRKIYNERRSISWTNDGVSRSKTTTRARSIAGNMYDLLAQHSRTKVRRKESRVSVPEIKLSPLPTQSLDIHHSSRNRQKTGSRVLQQIDLPIANGAILNDTSSKLFLILPSISEAK